MKKRGVLSIFALFVLLLTLQLGADAKAANYVWKTNRYGNKYCYLNGKLVKNRWVGNRHLSATGKMDRNKWIPKKVNGVTKNVFVRDDGLWVKNFKAGWQKIGNYYYYYLSSGVMVKNKWISIPLVGKYYVNSKGQRLTGLVKMSDGYRYFTKDGISKAGWVTIQKKKYYFQSGNRLAVTGLKTFSNGRTYYFKLTGIMATGWVKLHGKYYYFKNDRKTGWLNIGSKRYYLLSGTGERATGLQTIDNKFYYFNSSGVMQKNTTVTYEGRKYVVTATGECNLIPDDGTPSDDMLFFLTFESGSEAYDQTGGDNGCACGAYQFDYRYSLLEFVQYAYSQNAELCAEFKLYAAYNPDNSEHRKKFKSNKKFYTAWHTIYARNPKEFAALQDKFARVNYYDPVEAALARAGINLGVRSDVVKGAVYSYSIQHGTGVAVDAVKACKITAKTTDAQFLEKLYTYRGKKFPAYLSRYQSEYLLALSKLETKS